MNEPEVILCYANGDRIAVRVPNHRRGNNGELPPWIEYDEHVFVKSVAHYGHLPVYVEAVKQPYVNVWKK